MLKAAVLAAPWIVERERCRFAKYGSRMRDLLLEVRRCIKVYIHSSSLRSRSFIPQGGDQFKDGHNLPGGRARDLNGRAATDTETRPMSR
jgi:hypothetical protein